MIVDALKWLYDVSVCAEGPNVTKPPGEPAHVYILDGQRMFASPEPRAHEAFSLDAIVQFAQREQNPVVWYNDGGATVILDDSTRRDRCTLVFDRSAQLATISGWGAKSPPMEQAQLLLLLRTLFKYNLQQAPKLLDILKSIRFTSGKLVDSTALKNKSSISRSIEEEVTGVERLPDDFMLNVPIFAPPFNAMEGAIEVALEADAASETFTLYPLPGAIESAVELAVQTIGARLREALGKDVMICHGQP